MTARIVIVTSAQPAANPRMVKEATTLYKEGFKVTVIYCPISRWATDFDKKIINENPGIQWICTSRKRMLWARLRLKAMSYGFWLRPTLVTAENSIALYAQELKWEAIQHTADLYIGHNLAALPAVAAASLKHNAKYAFDCEDFHRGETQVNSPHYRKICIIEDAYLPRAYYVTASSPHTKQAYENIYNRELTCINNCFPIAFLNKVSRPINTPINLFWFSQYVGINRGLENIITVLANLDNCNYKLSIAGNCIPSLKEYFESLGKGRVQMNFMGPISPDNIFDIAAENDIGLAVEPNKDLNNNICLSNKIFTYLLAGNAILFSNTKGQQAFFKENPGCGYFFEKWENLGEIFIDIYNNKQDLLQRKKKSLELAREKYNWELESRKFLALVNNAIAV